MSRSRCSKAKKNRKRNKQRLTMYFEEFMVQRGSLDHPTGHIIDVVGSDEDDVITRFLGKHVGADLYEIDHELSAKAKKLVFVSPIRPNYIWVELKGKKNRVPTPSSNWWWRENSVKKVKKVN